MLSILPSIAVLGVVAVLALRLALRRSSPVEAKRERTSASVALGFAAAIQSAHFGEEWATGFHARFPGLLGLDPMPLSYFVAFNLAFIAIWIVSVPLLRVGRRPAFFAAWFIAIAGILNGIAHPLMAIAVGGYFPGLLTSPFIGFAGLILWQRLQRATSEPLRVS